jgi:outer membrane protein TolC
MTHRPSAALRILAVLLLAAFAPVEAQTRPATASTDTIAIALSDAIAHATDRSEEVRLARSQVELARGQVRSARSAAMPQLDANIAYTRTFASPFQVGTPTLPDSLRFSPDPTAPIEQRVSYLEDRVPTAGLGGLGALFGNLPFGQENAYTFSLSGSQPLYSGGRVGAALDIAGEYEDAARLTLREELAEIELQVRNAYYRARLAQELETIAQAAVEQAERFLNEERLRLRAGTASELEVLRAEVALENLRPQLVQARNAASLALLELKRLTDIPLRQPIRLTTPLEPPGATELARPAIDPQLLVARRAAIQAAERQVEIRERQVRIARGAFLPSVDLSFNYGRQVFPAQPLQLGNQLWRTDATATIGVRVPIFSGFRRSAEVQLARIELERERLRVAQLRETVQLQYEQAIGERERAAATIAARQRTVHQAQRVHDLTVLRYERGLATQLEVADARLALLQARTNLAQAITDFYIADASVTRAVGDAGSTTTRPTGR